MSVNGGKKMFGLEPGACFIAGDAHMGVKAAFANGFACEAMDESRAMRHLETFGEPVNIG